MVEGYCVNGTLIHVASFLEMVQKTHFRNKKIMIYYRPIKQLNHSFILNSKLFCRLNVRNDLCGRFMQVSFISSLTLWSKLNRLHLSLFVVCAVIHKRGGRSPLPTHDAHMKAERTSWTSGSGFFLESSAAVKYISEWDSPDCSLLYWFLVYFGCMCSKKKSLWSSCGLF